MGVSDEGLLIAERNTVISSIVIDGLGKMGLNMALKAQREGFENIFGYDSSLAARERASAKGLQVYASLEGAVEASGEPGERAVWVMLPAYDPSKPDPIKDTPTEFALSVLYNLLEPGDLVANGGNTHWENTDEWARRMMIKKILFGGAGVSGGITAAEVGYPVMFGGDREAYDRLVPFLDALARNQGAHHYFGEGGRGHLVKAGHNGAEYPLMQAIGEAFGVMVAKYPDLSMLEIAKLWQKGTLMSGFMMDRLVELLEMDPNLETIEGVIGSASGETEWIILEGKKRNLPVDSIEQAADFRKLTAEDPAIAATVAAKIVAGLRLIFGGHDIKRLIPQD